MEWRTSVERSVLGGRYANGAVTGSGERSRPEAGVGIYLEQVERDGCVPGQLFDTGMDHRGLQVTLAQAQLDGADVDARKR